MFCLNSDGSRFLNFFYANKFATLCPVDLLHVFILITETIPVARGHKYFRRGPYVGQPCPRSLYVEYRVFHDFRA